MTASTALNDQVEPTAADFLAGEGFPAALRSWKASRANVRTLARRLGEARLIGLIAPEEHGGMAAGLPELAAMFRAVGRHLLPLPLIDTVAAVGTLATHSETTDLIPGWIAGTRVLTCSVGAGDGRAFLNADTVTGRVFYADGAATADDIVIRAADGDFVALAVIDLAQPGVDVRPCESFDLALAPAEVVLESARTAAVIRGDAARQLVARYTAISRVATSAHLSASAAHVLELAVEYAKERVQFGRPIGSFQAVKHLAADAKAWTYSMDLMVRDVVRRPIGNLETSRRARSTKAFCSRAAVDVAQNVLQILAGIGFTYEHDLALFYPRILTLAGTGGGPRALENEIGAELLSITEPGGVR